VGWGVGWGGVGSGVGWGGVGSGVGWGAQGRPPCAGSRRQRGRRRRRRAAHLAAGARRGRSGRGRALARRRRRAHDHDGHVEVVGGVVADRAEAHQRHQGSAGFWGEGGGGQDGQARLLAPAALEARGPLQLPLSDPRCCGHALEPPPQNVSPAHLWKLPRPRLPSATRSARWDLANSTMDSPTPWGGAGWGM
jgi:hypothetical protein